MSYQPPAKCPVCGTPLRITKMTCPSCNSELTGSFQPCRYCALEERQRMFLETFLKSRGNLKDVERALSLSYPTVKNLLEELLRTLFPEEETQREGPSAAAILDRLENKEITVAEAAAMLAKQKGEF